MDFLRSCYRTRARLRAGSAEDSELRWYWCEDGALPLPFPTAIHSRTWDANGDEDLDRPIGEVAGAKRHWTNGVIVDPPTGQDEPVGEPEWFLTGSPADQDVERDEDGVCVECRDERPRGGIRIGGELLTAPGATYVEPRGIQVGGTAIFPATVGRIVGCAGRGYGMPPRLDVRITDRTGVALGLPTRAWMRTSAGQNEISMIAERWVNPDGTVENGTAYAWYFTFRCYRSSSVPKAANMEIEGLVSMTSSQAAGMAIVKPTAYRDYPLALRFAVQLRDSTTAALVGTCVIEGDELGLD